MLPTETLTIFFAASVGLALSPGPDNVFVLTQAASNGRRAGLIVTFGLCTGLLVHTAAVAFGVATLIKNTDYGFLVLKFLGASYLSYLSLQLFSAGAVRPERSTRDLGLGRLYRRGILMNVTNPKVTVFFLAFLPQFTNPESESVTLQILVLGGLFIIATALVFGSIAWFSGFLRQHLFSSDRAQKVLNRASAAIFLGVALQLLFTEL